jgi:DNA-binding transcriptional ArsR family regulator
MPERQHPGLRFVHRALADPMRLGLLESLWRAHPQSAKQLAEWAGVRPDRLYYHLSLLEQAGLIEIAEYRPLPGGKVERMYRPTSVEPPGDEATPLEVAQFLSAALEATQADITSASVAKEAGERREIHLLRATLRMTEEDLLNLREKIHELVRTMQDKAGDDGVWSRVVVTCVDLEDRDRRTSTSDPAEPQS